MTLVLFKFIIYTSCKRALNNGRAKSQIFRKSSLNFTFGQGSCLISEFAKNLLRFSPRFDIGTFNNNFAFRIAEFLGPVISSFCSIP